MAQLIPWPQVLSASARVVALSSVPFESLGLMMFRFAAFTFSERLRHVLRRGGI
jgi:hypothetical protein